MLIRLAVESAKSRTSIDHSVEANVWKATVSQCAALIGDCQGRLLVIAWRATKDSRPAVWAYMFGEVLGRQVLAGNFARCTAWHLSGDNQTDEDSVCRQSDAK